MEKTIFQLVVSEKKVNPLFKHLMEWPGTLAARTMLDKFFQSFEDPDGNFLEQFQTNGFDQRYFEIYLYAYLYTCGFNIDRKNNNPDFIVDASGIKVAIEATTAAPSQGGVLAKHGKKIQDLSYTELKEYQNEELPIRFGGPLFSKLQKKYWDQGHCKGLPFVIAIEAFHDEGSLGFSDASLTQYLYGFRQTGHWTFNGELVLEDDPVLQHQVADKVIPSAFFNQPDTENISAIIFTNSGTNAKFQRMGYQYGIGCENLSIRRIGFCLNPEPTAMDPSYFSYSMSSPPFVETWGQGLVVLHNPNAKNPLPLGYFPDAVEGFMRDGKFHAEFAGWHPISSMSLVGYHEGGHADAYKEPFVLVEAIPKEQFEYLFGYRTLETNPILTEQGWFADHTGSFLGVLTQDKIDHDWGFVVLGRNSEFEFNAIELELEFATRDEARIQMQSKISSLLNKGKRIFDAE
jgi:hypothetical protein